MNTLLKPLQVRETLLKKNVRTFTVQDFESIFHTTPKQTKLFLRRQTEEGLLARLKQGMYALQTDFPSGEIIANSLYRPSYISFEYALAFWGILPEMPYSITSATTKPTRDFVVNSRAYSYFTIKPEAYTGYRLVSSNNRISLKDDFVYFSEMENNKAFLIAEPEKALVDYLYFVSLGKRSMNDRLYIKPGMLSKRKLVAYAKLYNRKKLMELVKAVYDNN